MERRWVYKQENEERYHMIEGDLKHGYRLHFDIRRQHPAGHYAGKVDTFFDGHRTIKAYRTGAQIMAVGFLGDKITFKEIQATLYPGRQVKA